MTHSLQCGILQYLRRLSIVEALLDRRRRRRRVKVTRPGDAVEELLSESTLPQGCGFHSIMIFGGLFFHPLLGL